MRVTINSIVGQLKTAAAALTIAAIGVTAQRAWTRSRAACVHAQDLALTARDLLDERRLAEEADPFVERIFKRRLLPERLRPVGELAKRARDAAEAPLARFQISDHATNALRALAQTEGQPDASRDEQIAPLTALAALGTHDLRCTPGPETEEADLHARVTSETRALTGSAEVHALEREWRGDATIYCRSLLELSRLARVRATQSEACKKRPPKYTQGCRREATLGLEQEIRQLTEVREVNERKLRDKWGERLASRVRCDLPGGANPSGR